MLESFNRKCSKKFPQNENPVLYTQIIWNTPLILPVDDFVCLFLTMFGPKLEICLEGVAAFVTPPFSCDCWNEGSWMFLKCSPSLNYVLYNDSQQKVKCSLFFFLWICFVSVWETAGNICLQGYCQQWHSILFLQKFTFFSGETSFFPPHRWRAAPLTHGTLSRLLEKGQDGTGQHVNT